VSWRVLIAPDSFKGSLTALEAGEAIGRGFAGVIPSAEIRVVPLADGGEGTVETLRLARGGRVKAALVTGPLGVELVPASWAVLEPDQTAVIEMAQASGLPLVPPERRDPMVTTTAGTGELIREALEAGCSHILVGLGGSATVDGGLGAMRALGARLLDDRGRPIAPGGRGLASLDSIDVSAMDPRLARTRVTALADVDNPLVGPDGAARVFGPQKGADPATVEMLDRGLGNLARVAERDLGLAFSLSTLPGGGAAGGLGAALIAFLGARLVRGIDYVMEASGLAAQVEWAELVITGEGALDGQSRRGKTCAGVARLAGRLGRPVVAVVGSVMGEEEAVSALGLAGVVPAATGPMSLVQALAGAAGYLEAAGARLARLLMTGARLGGFP
jgi:glycerate kinase